MQQVQAEKDKELNPQQQWSGAKPSGGIDIKVRSPLGPPPPCHSPLSFLSWCLEQDLSWGDREKVLRLLFAKINNQAQQVHLSNVPQHSFAPAAPEYLPLPDGAGQDHQYQHTQ